MCRQLKAIRRSSSSRGGRCQNPSVDCAIGPKSSRSGRAPRPGGNVVQGNRGDQRRADGDGDVAIGPGANSVGGDVERGSNQIAGGEAMTNMNCQDVRGLLHAYTDNELDAMAAQQIEAHMAECAVCRRAFEADRAVKSVLANPALLHAAPASCAGESAPPQSSPIRNGPRGIVRYRPRRGGPAPSGGIWPWRLRC